MTLEELVIAVQSHRDQMAPLVNQLTGVADDPATAELAGLLEASDRQLGNLCHRLNTLRELHRPTERQDRWI